MKITREEVARIADLARLELKEEKVEKFAFQFSDIIGYMDKMNSLDTSGVEPLYSPSENRSVMREDEAIKDYQRKDLLSSAPDHDDEYLIVPKIL